MWKTSLKIKVTKILFYLTLMISFYTSNLWNIENPKLQCGTDPETQNTDEYLLSQ